MSEAFVTEPVVDDRLLAAYQPLFRQNARAIRDSWDRCREAGLGCRDRPRRRRVSAGRLAGIYSATAGVRALALAEMRLLHGHLGARGFTLTLADPDSVILDCLPGSSITAEDAADLAPGNCWPEAIRGTNAVGTAAAVGRVVVVAGEDHYLETYRGLICVATPIFGADGDVRAIIDATADQPVGSHTLAYTLGLMQMAGGHIQTELFRRRHADALVVLLDSSDTLGGPSAVALAFESDGTLRATTAGARTVFAHGLMAPGTAFDALFAHTFDGLADTIRPPAGFTALSDHRDRVFQATVYLPAKAFTADRGGMNAGPAGSESTPSTQGTYIAEDANVRAALDLAARATAYGVPILIRGETGSGKEHVARHIHAASRRKGEFVAINCAGLPAELIEAELFGHAPGAFTGARAGGAQGLVRRAHGGTLFLDEIGDMPAPLQAHLLRLIDTWQVRPVGAENDIPVDVQLVTATHRDLDAAVGSGAFRRDLLHRIGVCHVELPPLRQRSDLETIAGALLAAIDDARVLDASAVDAFGRYAWPGNIRELRNVITRLVLETPDRVIGAAHVGRVLHSVRYAPGAGSCAGHGVSDATVAA
ncbi:sigma-54-dependent Fis family transcriptional regulator, partial [Salinisphaera sp.]|uniref:sigma-54-dependent Fis family transcriptional regulator n=1 Tax=Salinisphaera sp. TaxID=1914330 RepID=UPI002D77C8CB